MGTPEPQVEPNLGHEPSLVDTQVFSAQTGSAEQGWNSAVEAQAMVTIGRQLGFTENLPALFDLLWLHMPRLGSGDELFLAVFDQGRKKLETRFSAAGESIAVSSCPGSAIERAVCRRVIVSARPLLFGNLAEEAPALKLPTGRRPGLAPPGGSLAVAPVLSKGAAVAALGLASRQPDRFSARHLAFLNTIGSLVGPAVETLLVQKKIETDLRKRFDQLLALQGEADRERQDLAAILHGSPDILITIDRGKRIASWNPAAESTLGWVAAEVLGRPCREVLQCGDDWSRAACDFDCRFDYCLRHDLQAVGGRRRFVRTRSGERLPVESSLAIIREPDGRVSKGIYVLRDVSAVVRREQSQQALVTQYRQLTNDMSSLYRLNQAGSATLELPELLRVTAEGAARVLGISDSATLLRVDGGEKLVVQAVHSSGDEPVFRAGESMTRDTASELFDLLRGKAPASMPRQIPGQAEPGSALYVPIHDGAETFGLLALVERRQPRQFSVRDRRLAKRIASQVAMAVRNARLYERVQSDLATKSALVQEMHHRVKNGLQMVAGLLRLETLRPDAPDLVKDVLERSIARIDSIAEVHDLLAHVGDERIGSSRLMDRIVQSVTGELVSDDAVKVTTGGIDAELPTREAISLGLIINELVCNAIQHAFPEGRKGHVEVSLKPDGHHLSLEVRDDGVGLPAGFDLASSGHLGLQIVRNLVERDLKGRFSFVSQDSGATAAVRFPYEANDTL